MTVSKIAELGSIVALFAAGFIWVGSINADVGSAKKDIEKVQQAPTDVAVLKAEVQAVKDSVKDVKDTQVKQDEKLDRILEEVRKR